MSAPFATHPKPGILDLVREDLRAFAGYASARSHALEGLPPGSTVWLNANESPWTNAADTDGLLRRYPQPQPEALRVRLAEVYGVRPEQLLIGRGSDEAIDLLVRALCRAEHDPIVIAPPVFGMYAVCARLQGAPLIEAPLRERPDGWMTDLAAMRDLAVARHAKIVFLCSPGNPTGELIPLAAVRALAQALAGRALVVVDEAYIEFADAPSAATLIDAYPNIAVLRTLSKLHALAGARIGCVLADPALIAVLRRCQAPYPVPQPCAELALRALEPAALAEASARVVTIRAERERMFAMLPQLDGVRVAYPSAGNFLLARFDDAETAYRRLLAAGVVVRDMRATPGLGDALRITVGSPDENDAVFAALKPAEVAA
ncbi:MAG: histidinol-phosphate transaminase [Lysobacter sp.]|nr:histidinol-phosphate transaminase [Lysobacter sp.]